MKYEPQTCTVESEAGGKKAYTGKMESHSMTTYVVVCSGNEYFSACMYTCCNRGKHINFEVCLSG